MSFLLSYPQGTPNHFPKAKGSRGDVPGHHWSKIKSEVAPTERGERNSFSLPMSISPRQLRAGRTSQPVIPLRGLGFPSCAEHCQRPVSVTEEKEGEKETRKARAWAPIWGDSWVTWSTRSSTEALSFGTIIEISGWKEGTFQDLLRIWLSTIPAPSGSRAFQPVPNLNKRSPQHSLAQSFFKMPQRAYSGISIKVSLSFFFPLQSEHAAS